MGSVHYFLFVARGRRMAITVRGTYLLGKDCRRQALRDISWHLDAFPTALAVQCLGKAAFGEASNRIALTLDSDGPQIYIYIYIEREIAKQKSTKNRK